MDTPAKYKPSPLLVLVSFAGAILAGIGLADSLRGTGILPFDCGSEHIVWCVTAIGYVMTLPYMIMVTRRD